MHIGLRAVFQTYTQLLAGKKTLIQHMVDNHFPCVRNVASTGLLQYNFYRNSLQVARTILGNQSHFSLFRLSQKPSQYAIIQLRQQRSPANGSNSRMSCLSCTGRLNISCKASFNDSNLLLLSTYAIGDFWQTDFDPQY